MLGWIRKSKPPVPDAPAHGVTGPIAIKPAAPTPAPASSDIDWNAKLQVAMGDDTALLALACVGAPLELKLAAVGALSGEAALKLAEREFRSHDRRVHRLAKQRWLAQVAQREAREKAARLIEAAKVLADEPLFAVNRAVELDRAWLALEPTLLDAGQRAEFTTLTTQLTTLTRDRADRELMGKRWRADARHAHDRLQAACTEAAAGTQGRSQLGAATIAARTVADAAPEGNVSAALGNALVSAAELDTRLALLEQVLQAPSTDPPAADVGSSTTDAGATATAAWHDPVLQWQQLAPLTDAALGELLNHRFEQWQQTQDEARQAAHARRREQTKDQQRVARNVRTEALAAALAHAEAALTGGHVLETHRHLIAIDELVHGGAPADALRARIGALQDRYAQLQGWQHWAGGRARDDLTLQAEALAAASGGAVDARIGKLSIKQLAEVTDELRARWKELDRLGGATSRALWQRFDSALRTAYEPVVAQAAAQRAAREHNLLARQQLIEALEAVPWPAVDEEGLAPDPRSLVGALDRFQAEWRKLGPLEHTVPHKARDKLAGRMSAAMQRLEAPLDEVRRGAQIERERLIARARSLGAQAQGRDLANEARALQSEWQQHAKALPLARAAESAMWAEFRTAIDDAFAARAAALSARDAEFSAHGTERAALILRLEALADTPAAERKRMLAEVDAAWQRCGPAPRRDAAALDTRFRAARDAARLWLAGSAQRDWHATCDALDAKLALCEALEHGAEQTVARAELAQRWQALPALPALWEQALCDRAGLPVVAASANLPVTLATDDLLLQLEAAWALASPLAFEAARRALKLQAMKEAMEGRRASKLAPLTPDHWLAAALRQTALDGLQRERLGAVIAALRQRGSANLVPE